MNQQHIPKSSMAFNPDDYKFQVSVDENEDTEWNDILRDHGIIPQKQEVEDAQVEEELNDLLINTIKNKKLEDKLNALNFDEIDEDDFKGSEAAFINNYKVKKIQELKAVKDKQKNSETFGSVQEINKPEYNMIIESNRYKDKYIFISLYSTNLQSKILLNNLSKLASGFPYIKFVQIKGETCIENYPIYMCPTIIIYKNNQIVKQMVSLKDLKGNDTNFDDLKEWVEIECNTTYDDDVSSDSESEFEDDVYANRNKRFLTGKHKAQNTNNSDSDSDFFD